MKMLKVTVIVVLILSFAGCIHIPRGHRGHHGHHGKVIKVIPAKKVWVDGRWRKSNGKRVWVKGHWR